MRIFVRISLSKTISIPKVYRGSGRSLLRKAIFFFQFLNFVLLDPIIMKQRLSPYRAVNTLLLGYKISSVNAV